MMLADTETKYDFSDWEVAEEEYRYTYDIAKENRNLTEEEISIMMDEIMFHHHCYLDFISNDGKQYDTLTPDRFGQAVGNVWELEGEPLKDGDIMTFTIGLCTPSRVAVTR